MRVSDQALQGGHRREERGLVGLILRFVSWLGQSVAGGLVVDRATDGAVGWVSIAIEYFYRYLG